MSGQKLRVKRTYERGKLRGLSADSQVTTKGVQTQSLMSRNEAVFWPEAPQAQPLMASRCIATLHPSFSTSFWMGEDAGHCAADLPYLLSPCFTENGAVALKILPCLTRFSRVSQGAHSIQEGGSTQASPVSSCCSWRICRSGVAVPRITTAQTNKL